MTHIFVIDANNETFVQNVIEKSVQKKCHN